MFQQILSTRIMEIMIVEEEILILKEDAVKFEIILVFLALDVVLETTNLFARFVADRILRMNILERR